MSKQEQEQEQEQQQYFRDIHEPNEKLSGNIPPVRHSIDLNSNHSLPYYAHIPMNLINKYDTDEHMITSHVGYPLENRNEHSSSKRRKACFGTYTEQSFGQEHSLGFFDDISKKQEV